MIPFRKNVDDDLATIDALLTSTEKSFYRDFFAMLAAIQAENTIKIIRQFLERGEIEKVIEVVNNYAKPLAQTVREAVTKVGQTEVKILEPKAQKARNKRLPANAPKPNILVTFEPGNPRAADLISNQTQTLIREITEEQRQIIYDAVQRGLMDGSNSRVIAKDIVDNIGLTRKQEQAVRNYRRLLEQGSKEALNRALRDQRSDSVVANAVKKPLTKDQINRMVDAYRKNYVRYRAEAIARTEAGRAMSEAQEEALRQTMEDVGFTEDEVIRTWHATKDKRTRDTHRHLDGQKQPMNVPFNSVSGARLRFPRDPQAPAYETINCRCHLTSTFI